MQVFTKWQTTTTAEATHTGSGKFNLQIATFGVLGVLWEAKKHERGAQTMESLE